VLLAIAIPIVFSNLLTVTMGIVDLAFVGRIGKTAGPDRFAHGVPVYPYPYTLAEPTQAVTTDFWFFVPESIPLSPPP